MNEPFKVCPHCAVNNLPNRDVCWQCEQSLTYVPQNEAASTRPLTSKERRELVCAMLDLAVVANAAEPVRSFRLYDPTNTAPHIGDWLRRHLPHIGGHGTPAGSH